MYSPLIIFTLWIGLPISIYGTVYNQKFAKIVNGERAPAIYPYQISLQKVTKTADDWKHVCGGAIVTEQHVVTAAHCVAKKKASRLSIWAASTSLDGDGERYLVKHYRKHPEFYESRTWLTSDIGIITIHGSFKFSENIRPIEYTAEEVGDGAASIVTGWGDTQHRGKTSNTLQHVNQTTITNEICTDKWKGRYGAKIDETHICAAGQGPCEGDSGSPLAKDNQLIGIASFGHACGGVRYPNGYARVSKFYQWIKDNTKVVNEVETTTTHSE